MDVLSSQANIAGYKAVMIAANEYGRFMPMLMTAAGTVKAARVLILGVGVAGLQAIATAKRLGAVIEASDVRPVGQGPGRIARREMGRRAVRQRRGAQDRRRRRRLRAADAAGMDGAAGRHHRRALQAVDILITTALIPGRPAPKLIKAETVAAMKPGAVIVDLAVEQGGNVEGSELDKIVVKNGVKIVGIANLPARVPADASALYARNVLNFLALSLNAKTGEFAVPADDEIIGRRWSARTGRSCRRSLNRDVFPFAGMLRRREP